jgi:predicted ATPase
MRATVSPSLVGREADLDALRDACAESIAGSTRAVLVGGEAGIGKTRLVGEFLRSLPADAIVLRGQSVDFDRDAPPYAPILSALRSLAQEVGAEALFDASGPAGDALALLLPELRTGASIGDVPVRGGADRLYDAVAEVLENVAAIRPVVLVIEDLHWVDPQSLGLLRFLIRVIEDARLLIVLTFRSDELGRGSALRALLPELDRNRRVTRLELARLDRRQVRELATARPTRKSWRRSTCAPTACRSSWRSWSAAAGCAAWTPSPTRSATSCSPGTNSSLSPLSAC